jgi:carbonic anhydrase
MTNIDMLLERNRAFARTNARDRVPTIPFIPNRQGFVITCIDPRVDPAAVLGLQLGDALIKVATTMPRWRRWPSSTRRPPWRPT